MRTIWLTITIMLSSLACNSQVIATEKNPAFGICIGLNQADTRAGFLKNTTYEKLTVTNAIGFRLGLLMDWKILRRLSVYPKTELVFNDSKMRLSKTTGETDVFEVYPIVAEPSLNLKYKLLNKYTSLYVLGGAAYRVPLVGSGIQYASARSSLSANVGVGIEKKFQVFTLAPELIYSYAVTSNSAVPAVEQLQFNSVIISVNIKR